MPDPSDKMADLAKRVLDRTLRGQISWRATEGTQNQMFQAKVGDLTVSIRPRDNDGNQPYVFGLWRQEPGAASGLALVENIDSTKVPAPVAVRLGQLWVNARAQALDINESIDAALAALDE